MTNNLRIWNAVSKTDPKHTKPFKRAGGFQGTAVKPIWQTLLLTEKFGPAGHGWGMEQPSFETVTAGEEILVFCTVALWYMDGDKRGTVFGVGGDKVLGKNKYGPFTNDEAFKASYTDALSNAMKQIGVAADIHMGLFDDEKYVREATREFAGAGVAAAANNSLDEARREIEQQTGNTTTVYQAKAKEAAKKWADTAIGTLNTAQSADDIAGWKEANVKALARLEENHPDQHDRVITALDNASLSLRNRAA